MTDVIKVEKYVFTDWIAVMKLKIKILKNNKTAINSRISKNTEYKI